MENQVVINTFVKETGGYVASQLEACTRCGMCAEACHFYQATENPEFAPIWKIELLKRAYEQRFTLVGKAKLALGIDKPINDEDLLHFSKIVYEACTMCNKCSMVCPMGIQLGPLIHEVRTGFSKAGVVPADLMAAACALVSSTTLRMLLSAIPACLPRSALFSTSALPSVIARTTSAIWCWMAVIR